MVKLAVFHLAGQVGPSVCSVWHRDGVVEGSRMSFQITCLVESPPPLWHIALRTSLEQGTAH
jgi:hypothetical protein